MRLSDKLSTGYLLATALFFFTFVLNAQPQSSTDVLVRAELNHTVVFIGDQVTVQVKISAPPGTEVRSASLTSSGQSNTQVAGVSGGRSMAGILPASIEIIKERDINVVSETPELLMEKRWELQTFDTGYMFIPELAFPYKAVGSNTFDTAYTEELLLQVRGIPLNDESELMPIKPIIKENRNWLDFWPAYLAIFLIMGGVLVWRYLKYRKDRQTAPPPPPPKPAYLLALERLDALQRQELWQQGQLKEYYSGLSRILRVYLEDRFRIPAMESTTKQITRALAVKSDFDARQTEELSELLQLSDLVKFARAKPAADLHQSGLDRIRAFVNKTGVEAKVDVENTATSSVNENPLTANDLEEKEESEMKPVSDLSANKPTTDASKTEEDDLTTKNE